MFSFLLFNVQIFFCYFMSKQSSDGSFVSQGRQDILTVAIGREEHPGRVCTAGYGVGVRQIFALAPRSSSASPATNDQLAQMREQLKQELREELIRDFEQMLASTGISQQHTPMQQEEVLSTCARVRTKGICVTEEEDEEDTNTDISYRCKLFVGNPPCFVAIGRVYATGSMIHTVPLGDDFARVVIEEVRHVDVEVPMPTSDVRFVGETLGTFIVWPTHLLKAIHKKHQVCYHHFS